MSRRFTLALAFLLAAALPVAAESYAPAEPKRHTPIGARRFGELALHKQGFDHVLTWRGRTLARIEASTVEFHEALPDRKSPRFVLLRQWGGGGVCGGEYIVVDLTRTPPKLGEQIGSCEEPWYYWTGSQLIFEDVYDTVTYHAAGRGTRELTALPREAWLASGVAAYRRGDAETAIRYLWPLRDGKFPDAPYLLGRMAETGRGLPRNIRRAREFYVTASALGSAPAAERLASLYERGFGVPKDSGVAAAHRRRAEALRAVPQPAPFDDPASWRLWIGMHPFDRILGRNLFEVDEIEARMAALFTAEERRRLARYQTQAPVELREGWLMLQGCLPHECTNYRHSIMIEIDGPGNVACVGLTGRVVYDDRTDILAVNGLPRRIRHLDDPSDPFTICHPYGEDPHAARAQALDPRTPEAPFYDPAPSLRRGTGERR
jgi:Sel1 repeat